MARATIVFITMMIISEKDNKEIFMKEIKLSQGKVALIDDEDFDSISKYKWYAHKRRGIYYAGRNGNTINGKRHQIQMHRSIINVTDKKIIVDHKDHNGLNNMRINLRRCTQAQNTANKSSHKNTSSKYLGVSFIKKTNKWRAMIMKTGTNMVLGSFVTEEAAASAYNYAAIKYHGSFANLNVIN